MEKNKLFVTQGFNSPFSFFFFLVKKNKNITTTITTSGRVITKFLLAMYYSSLTRAFVSTPKLCTTTLLSVGAFCQHTQVPHSYQVMDVLSRVAFLHYYYYNHTLSWRSFLQETESTTRNFLMYCLECTVFMCMNHEASYYVYKPCFVFFLKEYFDAAKVAFHP